MHLRFIAPVLVGAALLLSAACDKKKEKLDTFVPICESSTKSLGDDSLSSDAFMQTLQNAMLACSSACDLDHKESCTLLQGHMEKLGKTAPDIVQSLCDAATDGGSLKKHACQAAKAGK